MLTAEELKSRTYEERQADNLQRIPLLSREWTNYNPSDPGITILENLTAFAALQGSDLTAIGYRARLALLKMAGFVPAKGKCARVLLAPLAEDRHFLLPSGQRFFLGNVCYETIRETEIGGARLKAVYGRYDEEYHDISHVLDRELSVPARIFGETPEAGDAVYFIIDRESTIPRDTIFHVRMEERPDRTPVKDRTDSLFADLKWEYYTAEGFRELEVRDFTGAFVTTGEIRFRFGDGEPTVYESGPAPGYCIRATLTRADYDVCPRMLGCHGFLFEVWQKQTKAFCQIQQKTDRISVRSPIGEDIYWSVYAREEKGASYRRYELASGGGLHGRFVGYETEPDGRMSFRFDEKTYGYAPFRCKDCVRIVGYDEEIMRRYRVGQVAGYDDEELELPVKNIVPESFCLIAKRTGADGEAVYDFVRPEKKGDGVLYYHLLENDGRIVIEDAGDFIGAELLMGSVATTDGKRGNVRAGNTFQAQHMPLTCHNPGEGTGGAFRETLEEVRSRFVRDMHTPYAAVTAQDYERLVLQTPGLCIKKAHAVSDPEENLVRIAVMPGTGGEHPSLSEVYRKRIEQFLEERRLITTRFRILQPVYAAVNVRCTVYVERHFSDCRRLIEERIREQIDYTSSGRTFGEPLLFEEVFRAIEELACVEYVYDLSLRPQNGRVLKLKEYDILPGEDCLCYPGDIQLETVSI